MNQDLKALRTLKRFALKSAKNSNDKSSLTRYCNRIERVLSNIGNPTQKYKIMILNEDKIRWGKERIGYIQPVENEEEGTIFTKEEAREIEMFLSQNGKIRIMKVACDDD